MSIWVGLRETKGRTLAEHAERELDDEQEDTTAGRETEDFWHEALVQRCGALFAEDRHQPVPSVVGKYVLLGLRQTAVARTQGMSSCILERHQEPCSLPVCAISRPMGA